MLLAHVLVTLQMGQLEELPPTDTIPSPSILVGHEMFGEVSLPVVGLCTLRALIYVLMRLEMIAERLFGGEDPITARALPFS